MVSLSTWLAMFSRRTSRRIRVESLILFPWIREYAAIKTEKTVVAMRTSIRVKPEWLLTNSLQKFLWSDRELLPQTIPPRKC